MRWTIFLRYPPILGFLVEKKVKILLDKHFLM